jgi:hypothetical protein
MLPDEREDLTATRFGDHLEDVHHAILADFEIAEAARYSRH